MSHPGTATPAASGVAPTTTARNPGQGARAILPNDERSALAGGRMAPARPVALGDRVGPGGWDRQASLTVAACLAVFALLALTLAWTRTPQADEGHFASAGASLAFRGRLAMPMWTAWIPTLDQRLYSNMPLYFVLLAGWFKAFGASWMAMRTLSVLWGAVLVAAGTGTVWALTRERRTTLLATLLLALNYDVVNYASARYDIMAAALSAAALASYLLLRERSLTRALVCANACLAAACLTHPYALFGLVTHAVFVLALDLRRLRVRHLLLAALPYLAALGLWGLYIAQDPAMFRAQFGANAGGRLSDALTPLTAVRRELQERYLERYAGWRAGAPLALRVKVGLLVAYLFGMLGMLLLPELRRRRGVLALVVATGLCAVLLGVVDSTRWYIYLVHLVPLYVLCLSLTAGALLARGGAWSHVVRAGSVGYVLFTLASVSYRARLDVHHQAFLPAVRFLQAQVREGDLVVAGGEFGMHLGFERHVHDDDGLRFPRAQGARFVVVSADYRAAHAAAAPARRQHVESTLAGYDRVLRSERGGVGYDVYVRRDAR